MHRWGKTALFAGVSLAVAGCPKGRPDFSQGMKAEALQDYDAAYEFYQKAAKSDPYNAGYKIRFSCPLVRRRRPQIQFLSIGPYLCSTLPSDPYLMVTPLRFATLHLHQVGTGL